jgi:hypothetical protein
MKYQIFKANADNLLVNHEFKSILKDINMNYIKSLFFSLQDSAKHHTFFPTSVQTFQ